MTSAALPPTSARRLVLVPAPRDKTHPQVRRYRLARVRLEGRAVARPKDRTMA
jgi:hypothetical protein